MLPSQWLAQQPKIAKALIWPGGLGRPISYDKWPAARRRQLDAIYMGRSKVPSEPPPKNLLNPEDTADADTRIGEDDAWALYLSYVAASLGCEIDKRVPWSILDYPASALAILLDARQMFDRRDDAGTPAGFQFNFGKSGFVLPAAAADSLAFLKANGIWPAPKKLGPIPFPQPFTDPAKARRRAAYRMIDWCRNLIHFFGGFDAANCESIWQYRGFAPAIRMIKQSPAGGNDLAHWTAGCWGTVGLIRSVLRAINIPVELRNPGSHAQLWLPLEGVGLAHGDDPYVRRHQYLPGQQSVINGKRVIWDSVFPVDELMIDSARYDELFATGLSLETLDGNTSATLRVIAVKYLPYNWLRARCEDIADPTKTAVSDYFGGAISEAEIAAMKLRERMDAKLATIGGCAVFG